MATELRKKTLVILRELAIIAVLAALVLLLAKPINGWRGDLSLTNTGLDYLDHSAALAAAEKSGKPVLLQFGARWCGACRKLNNEVMADAEVQQTITENYIIAYLEWESPEDREIFQRYGIEGFPVFVLLKPGEDSYQRLPLTYDPEQFLSYI